MNVNIINMSAIVKMIVSSSIVKKTWQIHKLFSENEEYSLKNLIRSIHHLSVPNKGNVQGKRYKVAFSHVLFPFKYQYIILSTPLKSMSLA